MSRQKAEIAKPKKGAVTKAKAPLDSITTAGDASREEIEAAIAALPAAARERVRDALQRYDQPKPPVAKLIQGDDGGIGIQYSSEDAAERAMIQLLLMRAFGTRSRSFMDMATADLLTLHHRDSREPVYNSAVAILESAKPENELEAMLVLQMIAANQGAVRSARMLANAETQEAVMGLGNLTNKFMRTYTAQMEALAKIRRGGEQVVRHIHVDNRGGQAVIAETVQTGGANGKSREQCHEPCGAASIGTAVLGPHTGRD